MLRREITIQTGLMHPNIVPIVSFSEFAEDRFIFSLWAEHGTLGAYLREHPNADRLKLLHGVASGLRYLHSSVPRVIHGDLCLDNVLVYGDENARLNDFGLSTFASPRLTDEASPDADGELDYLLTRARYTAPELNGDHPRRSPETDVFAFGMLAFHAYADRPPFSGLNHLAVIIAISEAKRPARADITRDDLPEGLWALMEACWSQDPEDRPSMLHVELSLQDILLERVGWKTATSAGAESAVLEV
ncbi:kinase-like protein [Auricularia subglabra TFB-10046 SS5]|nr:kinase-like protein [Auricularia subglabra TFB-10046 SS5]